MPDSCHRRLVTFLRPVDVERDPHDLEVAHELAVRLLPDLVDEPVHRVRDAREVLAQPGAVARPAASPRTPSWLIVTIPVTWLMEPSKYVRWTAGMNL